MKRIKKVNCFTLPNSLQPINRVSLNIGNHLFKSTSKKSSIVKMAIILLKIMNKLNIGSHTMGYHLIILIREEGLRKISHHSRLKISIVRSKKKFHLNMFTLRNLINLKRLTWIHHNKSKSINRKKFSQATIKTSLKVVLIPNKQSKRTKTLS